MIAAADQRSTPVSVVGAKRDYISHSAITTYQQCPLRYRFKYVDALPETVVSSALIFGGAIHSALEFHFTERLCGNESPSLDQLLDVFQEAWQGRATDYEDIRFGKGEDHNSLSALADRMLTAFRESPAVASDDIVIGIEEELRGELIPGVPDLLARIDLLTTTSDALVITDFKTARSRWSQNQAENSSSQLLLYSELARRLMPDREVRLRFLVLTKTKKPTVEAFNVKVNRRRSHRTVLVVKHTWRAIEAGHFYPAPSPMNCPTCPFRSECNAWTGD
ncbi:MAG: PD-(D/E)XK nuclease family protein [Rhodopirellula sp.]|nr:PD-(D/E)XK nuclease family protein [Rhodopirellula sp.]